jgi:hypothetical protein
MNDEPGTGAGGLSTAAHVVEVEGCYGAVTWSVESTLYSRLPRNTRDQAIDVAAKMQIGPFFTEAVEKALRHVGSSISANRISRESSFETIEFGCGCIGSVVWQPSQGFIDALPADQREVVMELMKENAFVFFHRKIILPLESYAMRSLLGD